MRACPSSLLRPTLLLLAVAPGLLAAQRVTDSAGARLLTYPRGARAPAIWTVEAKPVLRIGGAEGEGPSELAGVSGAARRSDGRIVIADGGALELRVFRADGTFERSIGRRGSGPSEFDRLLNMRRTADTMLVIDGTGRLQAFRPDGSLLRTLPKPTLAGNALVTSYGTLGTGAEVVLAVDVPFDTVSRRTRATAVVAVGGRRIAVIPAYELVRSAGRNQPLFLGSVGRLAVGSDRLCSGWTATWEVSCWRPSGQLAWRTRREVAASPVRAEDRELFREGFRKTNANAPKERIDAIAASFEFAEERSRFGRIEMATNGELWVSEFVVIEEVMLGRAGRQVPDRQVTWSVLNREGRWIADLTLPRGFHLLDAGPEYVVGVERDSDDVEAVTVYRYRRR